MQAQVLGATYYPISDTDSDASLPSVLIAHYDHNTSHADIGILTHHAKTHGRTVIVDIVSPRHCGVLSGIAHTAIAHCPICYHEARKYYHRVLNLPLPAPQIAPGMIPTTDKPEAVNVPLRTEYRLGWWGSMTPFKGLKRVVNITKLVRNLPDKIDLGVVAMGMTDPVHYDYPDEALAYVQTLKMEKCCFLDNQWRPLDVARATLEQCHLFCLPSHRRDSSVRSHNHSSAARFLLSLGKPVLVSGDADFDDVREFCFTVEDGSAEKFAMWVRGFLLDASLYAEYAERARRFGRERSLEAYGSRLREFLDAVV